MLSTLLTQAPWLPIASIGLFVVVAPLLGRWLLGRPRVARHLLAVALLVLAGLTLYPEPRGMEGFRCAIDWPYLHPFAVESMANVVLFLPIGFLAAIVLRRPLVGAAVAIGLSAVIEVVQALVPAIGRACDTGDWITNGLGALVGAAAAFVALAWHRRATRATAQASTPRER